MRNGWTIAELAGDASPDGMQRLLNFYAWDGDAVRDALRRYVVARLGDPARVLVADETGFIKKGRMSAGVARQYTGTAGQVENAQVGVFLAHAAPGGSRAASTRLAARRHVGPSTQRRYPGRRRSRQARPPGRVQVSQELAPLLV